MAAPLAALREGHAAWAVGVLLGLFAAAPIVLALAAGRLADRHGYHVPIRVAVALDRHRRHLRGRRDAAAGRASSSACASPRCFTGAGANFGLIAIQRSAGRMAHDPTELKQIFSWLGLAPALANVVGPVVAGTLIDAGGFRLAFVVLAALPLASLVWARFVPVEPRADVAAALRRPNSWDLLERARLHAAPARQLAALVELGRAFLPGADPRPRARLQRLGDRPDPRRLRDRGRRRAAGDPAARPSPARVARAGRRDADLRRRLRALSARPRGVGDGLLRRRPRPGARRGPADDHDDAAPDHAARRAMARRSPCARWRSTCRARSCRSRSASPARRSAHRRCSG